MATLSIVDIGSVIYGSTDNMVSYFSAAQTPAGKLLDVCHSYESWKEDRYS
jgi:hypothetical protein